ncbi:MAG TPA: two pore domain potassium channel family protein [Gammaproteobacteria bacterium]|nr:two pore domain potassium channel family protein [Gammaproteobacteria bacterium]
MFLNLFIGACVIILTVAVQAIIIGAIETVFLKMLPWLRKPPRIFKLIITLITVVLIVMVGVTTSVWIWAATFLLTGNFHSLEEAVYFATVSFTSLGFGDIVLEREWRLLSALSAANGLIVFGLSTAFLMEFMLELRAAQKEYLLRHKHKHQIKKQVRKQIKRHFERQSKDDCKD